MVRQGIEHLQHFDFITGSAEDVILHKYVVQNGRRVFRAISDMVGNSVLTSSQDSCTEFMRLEPAAPTEIFKTRHSNTTQSKDMLMLYLHAEVKI